MTPPEYVLVTGATGFIGANVVDCLLARGIRVRGTTRQLSKGTEMINVRPQFTAMLDFVQIRDFSELGVFDEAVKGVDGIIHVASPLTYDTTDNEKELVIPAINGVVSILEAAAATPSIQRIVFTSSFASVLDVNRNSHNYFTYTGADWNPLSYEEGISPSTSAVVAYRASKKFAELRAWDFVRDRKPHFDIVTLCPPMTFGPIAHPIRDLGNLNESNSALWKIASGMRPLPVARVPFWIDVRDLAEAHVQALLRPSVGGGRYVPAAPERFSYGLAAEVMANEFPWAKEKISVECQPIDTSHGIDGATAAKELGFTYRSFKQSIVDLISQLSAMDNKSA